MKCLVDVPTRHAIPRKPTSTNCRREAQTSLQPLSSSVSNAESSGENTENLDICSFYLDTPVIFTAAQVNLLRLLGETCMKAQDCTVLGAIEQHLRRSRSDFLANGRCWNRLGASGKLEESRVID
ncbi:hypothetical protein, variant 2 [Exophiala xenobiotica]|uniref:Uncharacterized protein n=1 Tax=Exophiala xenobiotica TaxID=348802 RepID=A0A0D2ER49_9EURO|nr:hypothetical protein, variant 2 [Exophiala xenobiotica]XP_013310842.1 hypothetical protein, variant 1 [Exophiala xenobiotica]KIW50258.1 hypothetical protein, variant 1 [Exophiala xenobiotica]KIW50259.1 hypothetical protein, variant 2 [Exophiala xenobiotica]